MELAARAPGDGYTIVLATVGTWVINPYLYKLSYEVLDFSPIIHVATTPGVLIVHPSLPVKSVKELIALAKQRPGELTYGSAGIGGFGHMSAELFSAMTKVKMSHVPYKGTGPSTMDLVGGHIQMLFNSAVPSVPHIKSGKVRALATSGTKRMAILPELPTVAEAGVPGYENSTWTGIGAPPKTPRAITERLNKELNAVLQLPEVQQIARNDGSVITGGNARRLPPHSQERAREIRQARENRRDQARVLIGFLRPRRARFLCSGSRLCAGANKPALERRSPRVRMPWGPDLLLRVFACTPAQATEGRLRRET